MSYDRFVKYIDDINRIPLPLRLVFVVNQDLQLENIQHIKDSINNKYELSFRELCGVKNENIINCENFIKNNKLYFIEQNDYNIYYMPNNEIWHSFF